MKFNRDGTLLLGGLGRLYVNGVTPRGMENFHTSGWDFLTNTTIAGQGAEVESGPWRLYEYDLIGRELWQLYPAPATTFYASSSSKWVAYLASNPLKSFEAGKDWFDRVAIGMSPQQDELFRPYPSYQGLLVRTSGGFEVDMAPGREVLSASMDAGVILYTTPGNILNGAGALGPLTPVSGCLNAQFVTLQSGKRMIVGYVPAVSALVLFDWVESGPLIGWLLSLDGHDFNPAIAQREDGIVVVGTGVDQGESRSRLYEIDLNDHSMRWATLPGDFSPWSQLPAVNLLQPPVILPELPRLNHNVSIAPYKDLWGMSGSSSEVLVNDQYQATNRPAWALIECLDKMKGPLLGLYTEGRPGNDGMEVLPKAKELKTRILWVWDDLGIPVLPPGIRTYDVIGLECYLPRIKGSESFDKSVQRWQQNLQILLQLWGNDIALVLQYYCMGGAPPNELYTVQEVVNAIGAAVPLVNTSTRVKLAACFSFDRANGISAHPELREMLRRLNVATPGPAQFRPVEPPIPPVTSTGGSLLMATITSLLQHVGTNKYGNKVTFNANAQGDVWSCQPNGTLALRPAGAKGDYELAVQDGQIASFQPISGGPIYSFVTANVAGL